MDAGLLETVVESALLGMKSFAKNETLEYPADYRLAFRELGLSIGLSAVENVRRRSRRIQSYCMGIVPLQRRIEELMGYMPLRETIEQFWMDGKNRQASHLDRAPGDQYGHACNQPGTRQISDDLR